MVALSVTREEGVFERRDICLQCWPQQSPSDFRCHWTSIFNLQRPSLLKDRDALWQIFHHVFARKSEEGGEEAEVEKLLKILYLVTLALIRLKELVSLDDSENSSHGCLAVRTRGKKVQHYEIFVPKLSGSEITALEQELVHYLG